MTKLSFGLKFRIKRYHPEEKKSHMVPWDKDTPDAKGFWNYVNNHYERCIEKAFDIVTGHTKNPQEVTIFTRMVFDKLASPLVYLWEAWNAIPVEKKIRYNPELAKIHEQVQKQVEEAFKKEEKQ